MSYADLRCPHCHKKAFEAAGPIPVALRWKCTRSGCGFIGNPVPAKPLPLQRTYRCSSCHRTQHLEKPVCDRTHCIVCGTQTLVIVSEIRPQEEKESVPVEVRRA